MVTASIVVHNSPPEEVSHAIECIKRSDINKIWIVFNGDPRQSSEYENIEGTEFILTENRGYGAAHNIAIQKAIAEGSEFHLIMNSDISFNGDVISPLVRIAVNDAKIGIIAPYILNPDGSLQYSCRKLPTPFRLFARRFLPELSNRGLNNDYLLKELDHSFPINAPYILGCFMIFRTEALRECGLFDERFFLYPEDIDITRRIHRNWKTICMPSFDVIHSHRRESRRSLRLLLIHIVNICRYFNKWGWFYDKERSFFNRQVIKNHKKL